MSHDGYVCSVCGKQFYDDWNAWMAHEKKEHGIDIDKKLKQSIREFENYNALLQSRNDRNIENAFNLNMPIDNSTQLNRKQRRQLKYGRKK